MDVTKGLTGQATRLVTEKDTAKEVRSGSLAVLATPVLSALMEEAAVAALAPYLPKGQTTVGGFIAVRHNAPTPVGQMIKAIATVTSVSGKKISFTITASDENGTIGEAEHTRFLVDEKLFMMKLQK